MIETTVIAIGGMTCPGCADTISNSLAKIDGVSSANTHYRDASASVIFNVRKISREALVRTVTDLGYEAQ